MDKGETVLSSTCSTWCNRNNERFFWSPLDRRQNKKYDFHVILNFSLKIFQALRVCYLLFWPPFCRQLKGRDIHALRHHSCHNFRWLNRYVDDHFSTLALHPLDCLLSNDLDLHPSPLSWSHYWPYHSYYELNCDLLSWWVELLASVPQNVSLFGDRGDCRCN